MLTHGHEYSEQDVQRVGMCGRSSYTDKFVMVIFKAALQTDHPIRKFSKSVIGTDCLKSWAVPSKVNCGGARTGAKERLHRT